MTVMQPILTDGGVTSIKFRVFAIIPGSDTEGATATRDPNTLRSHDFELIQLDSSVVE